MTPDDAITFTNGEEAIAADAARLSHDRGAEGSVGQAIANARQHVTQAFEWHRQGTRPTGQSAELQHALDSLDDAFRALSVPAPTLPALDVDSIIFDLPIGENVDYSRGYSAGVAAAREALREALRDAV